MQALGHQFRSRSDTEVLLAAWAEWGAKALDRFNGMFAFALWDRQARTLTLARDRYGVKPLYYAYVGGAFLYGSEIKAILAHGAYRTRLDKEALLEYFTFQNFFTDRTLFKDVHFAAPWQLYNRQCRHTHDERSGSLLGLSVCRAGQAAAGRRVRRGTPAFISAGGGRAS